MILYFSGTGNSKAVAEAMAQRTSDRAVRIDLKQTADVVLSADEPLGFVFPVYGWGLPKIVREWFSKAPSLFCKASNSSDKASRTEQKPCYVYAVLTCGDDVGLTDRELQHRLQEKGLAPDAIWSICMPDTYVALPCFDVDAEDLLQRKLVDARQKLSDMTTCINKRQKGVVDVFHGGFPWTKSHILGPFFNALLVNDRRFKLTAACNGCQRCAHICPLGNIQPDSNGKPIWNGHCTTCLACYHHCPRHAITCGAGTSKKGQYNPRSFPLNA